MTDETRPFWAEPANPTVAYIRPAKLTWREQGERYIEKIRDIYDAAWDLAPAIAAIVFLCWLITTFHR